MFIKSLTLSGFRSFYRPQILSFDPGMTAIIGPDGCGKSSVIQAILWALAHPSSITGLEQICSRPSRDLTAKGTQIDLLYHDNTSELDVSTTRTLSVNGLWATFKIDGHDYADSEPPREFITSRARVRLINAADQMDLALEELSTGDLFLINDIDDPSSLFLETLKTLTAANHQVIAITQSRSMIQITDQLIGVTMEELGVSKIVPMRLT